VFLPIPSQGVAEFAHWNSVVSLVDDTRQEQSFSALVERRQEMRVGRTCYRFIMPVTVNYVETPRAWTSYMTGLTGYTGSGGTQQQAFENLSVQIHTAFQALLRKRPFEMDDDEKSRWIQLASVIDLLYYKTTTPITTYEIGQVSFARVAHPHHINWINGKFDPIDPYKVPGELMSCRPGQWIDAVVRRDPVTHEVLEIESLRRISFRIPSQSELESAWETMPEAKLEPADWVW
jgi:hypothetical protein